MESKHVLDSWARDYDELAGILEELESEVGPAELHGTVTGLICGGAQHSSTDWLTSFFDQLATDKAMFNGDKSATLPLLSDQDTRVLQRFYELVVVDVNSVNFEFKLMLPGDDYTPLAERVSALSSWIQGYLVGIGSSGYFKQLERTVGSHSAQGKANSGEVQELLNDLVTISQVDHEVGESEENERYYMELVEYVKVLSLSLKEVCRPKASENPQQISLH